MESTEYTPWGDDTYVATGNTFEEWRKLTNGLKTYVDDTKVDSDGDTMTGPLAISDTEGEANYIQFPDGTQQFTAATENGPRAWVNFAATVSASGTVNAELTSRFIRSTYNIKTVTKLDAGKYKLDFVKPLSNTRSLVTGTAYFDFNNSDAVVGGAAVIVPYELQKDSVKIMITDPGDNTYKDPSLANVLIFSTNDSDASYIPGSQLNIKLAQSSGDVWRVYARCLDLKGDYRFRVIDGYGWSTTKFNSTSDVTIISKNNTGKNSISLLTLQVFTITGEIIKTYNIARKYGTGADINGSTNSNFTVSTLSGSPAASDVVLGTPAYVHTSNFSSIEFTITLP